jgi:hypothetical protein
MNINKKVLTFALAGAVSLGALGGGLVTFAAEPEEGTTEKTSYSNFEQHIYDHAEEYGIETEGKDVRDLAEEVMEAKVLKEAGELGIDTADKDIRELQKEVMKTKILNEAAELGIDTTDKDVRELSKEVMEAKVFDAAEQLGIDTTDKTTKEIMEEIRTDYADQAEELGLFPDKGKVFDFGGKGFGHERGQGHGGKGFGGPGGKHDGGFGPGNKDEQVEQENTLTDTAL